MKRSPLHTTDPPSTSPSRSTGASAPEGGPGDRLGVESLGPRPAQLMALTIGTRLGHYDVTALLGEGGMRQVWARARGRELERPREHGFQWIARFVQQPGRPAMRHGDVPGQFDRASERVPVPLLVATQPDRPGVRSVLVPKLLANHVSCLLGLSRHTGVLGGRRPAQQFCRRRTVNVGQATQRGSWSCSSDAGILASGAQPRPPLLV